MISAPTFSADDVWYVLDQDWLADEIKTLICKTIERLPIDVQDFAVCNCTFIDFGDNDHGQTYPASLFTHLNRRGRTMRNHWVIILKGALAKNKSQGKYTIAHEIAHAWLGHQIFDSNLLGEEQADALVESWGFKVPKYRSKVHAEYRKYMNWKQEAVAKKGGAVK